MVRGSNNKCTLLSGLGTSNNVQIFFNTEIESSEKKTRGKKNVVLEGVKEKIKEIIKHFKTKFKLEKTFFDSIEEIAKESVEHEEQVELEEHALVIVLSLLSLTCSKRKYRLYLNLIREIFWINQKVLEQTISNYKQKLQTYGVY